MLKNQLKPNFKSFNNSSFKEDLEYIDGSPATNNDNIDPVFRSFFHLFYTVLDKHAPQKEIVMKNKKLELKPWITSGITTSMKKETRYTK